jgi:hypothetical protein
VLALHILTRHDIIKELVVIKESKCGHVKVLDISNISAAYHTRHGPHLNKMGKEHILQEISKIMGKTEKKNTQI